jgi:O-antigen/teichoic acid export membrane protein
MLARDGAVYIASRALPGLLGLAATVALSWLLPPDDYGLYGLGIAAIALGNALIFEWLSQGLSRWYQSHQENPRFLATVIALFAACCLGALLIALAAHLALPAAHAALLWVLLGGICAHGWFELMARIHICRFHPTRYLAMSLLRGTLVLAATVATAWAGGSGVTVLAAAVGATLAAGLLLPARLAALRADAALARALVAYGAPFCMTMAFAALTTSINPVLIGALASREAVGGFTLSFTLVQVTLLVIADGINAAVWPVAVRAADSGDPAAMRRQLGRGFVFLLGVLLPAAVGLAVLAPTIARIAINPDYHDAIAQTTPWLSACAVMMALRIGCLDLAFQLVRRTGLLVWVTGGAAALNLALGVLLIPRFGALGAAVAMTVAVAVSVGHAALLAARHCPPDLPLREGTAIALAAALMGGLLGAMPELPGVSGLALTVLTGGAAYLLALAALEQLGLAPMLRPILADLLRRAPARAALPAPARAALPAPARLDREEA